MEFSVSSNLALLQEMMTCGSGIYTWSYTADGRLLNTNCPQLALDSLFEASGCKEYLIQYAQGNTAPLVLSDAVGLMWCVAIERMDGQPSAFHMLGPVCNSEISPASIDDAFRSNPLPEQWRDSFHALLCGLPVVSSVLFFQYTLFLHYCVTGQKLTRSDIRFQQSIKEKQGPGNHHRKKDRRQVYLAEQSLLKNVRDGNPDYQDSINQAGLLSAGVRVSTHELLGQARVSTVVFVSLCTRAAIEGGLSPELAYSLGDSYIQSAQNAKTMSELTMINLDMYKDFIQRVRQSRFATEQSKHIQSACDYILLHPGEELSVKVLAQRANYSEQYFSKKFRQEMGCSVGEYVKRVRIETAKQLLADTALPIHQIALQLHFCSSTHFSDAFRDGTGLLPKQYRAQKQRL